jgi:hypothetical protein
MKQLFFAVDREGWGLFGVERAEPDVFSSPLSERRVLGSDLYDIGNLPDLVNNLHLYFYKPDFRKFLII